MDKTRLELLIVGNEFDNFYELARYLGCKYNKTATNSIKAVKKEFDRYFTWERIGGSRRVRITGWWEPYGCVRGIHGGRITIQKNPGNIVSTGKLDSNWWG